MTIELDSADVLLLPVDELGLHILADVVAGGGREGPRNWMGLLPQTYAFPARRALAEAWQWLLCRGLVARDLEETSGDRVFVTRRGREVLASGLDQTRAGERLDLDLTERIATSARRQFLLGEYELAALASLRAVEIRVRELSGEDPSAIGVPLMKRAFGEASKDKGRPAGPLTDTEADAGEQAGLRDLFAGAIGALKNPVSHREVDYGDPTEAAEVVLLADLLMRILDRIEGRLAERT